MSTHRLERVNDTLRRGLARLLQEEVRDPRIGFVTITGVRVTPDLRFATVFVTSLDREHGDAIKALERTAPFLQRQLGRLTGLRHTPHLRFRYDESLDAGMRIESILDELDLQPEDDTAQPTDAAQPGDGDPASDDGAR